ncbi:tRNA 2-selenouridine(34) synthase MnmH [Paracoccus sp. S-4012]|uniref:tRNA 2-selenouridine(34) synthase MnmH n=1 Tax=Paracoccus sp. S-4012 TaxID=2665648 RepID=UPI0012B155D9|nr:tRNA 2-selenouridine(34) synthase MnmH [Paracoccus sp. S-4012]MRX49421.1 tRNA 2-selenouridine(34) synthase MnmH [Paracoccus sp. S-4012]
MLTRQAPHSVAVPAPGVDEIIDVRTPAEFAEDHLPGAINLPVLTDEERVRVGTDYRQVSAFHARRMGAALVAANAARHIAGPLSTRGGGWRPLVHCWRGGMRSGGFATILDQIGWRVTVLEGGYKAWRRLVVARVSETPIVSPVWVLDGDTGSGKTAVLAALARRGVQVVDLEGLANHRGSLFGGMPGGQPSQAMFEGRLAAVLEGVDPARPVVIEAESSRVGDRSLPQSIWAAITAAPRLRLEVPVEERARFTAATYREISAAPGEVDAILSRLAPAHPRERIADWRGMAARGEWEALALGLMQAHYDPRYRKHRDRYPERMAGAIPLPRLDAAGIEAAAGAVEARLPRHGGAQGIGCRRPLSE